MPDGDVIGVVGDEAGDGDACGEVDLEVGLGREVDHFAAEGPRVGFEAADCGAIGVPGVGGGDDGL